MSSDPEAEELIRQTRRLTNQAWTLERTLSSTLDELEAFSKVYDRRRSDAPPFFGEDRRRG